MVRHTPEWRGVVAWVPAYAGMKVGGNLDSGRRWNDVTELKIHKLNINSENCDVINHAIMQASLFFISTEK